MKQTEVSADIVFPSTLPFTVNTDSYLQMLEKACSNQAIQQLVLSFPYTCGDLLSWFDAARVQHSFHFYWEKPRSSHAMAGVGSICSLTARGSKRFQNIQQAINQINDSTLHIDLSTGQPKGTRLVGGFSFFDDLQNVQAWKGFEPALFTLPEWSVNQNGKSSTASIALKLDRNYTVEALHDTISTKLNHFFSDMGANGHSLPNRSPSEPEHIEAYPDMDEHQQWIQLINDAKESIAQNKLEKVVMGRQLKLRISQGYSPVHTVQKLRSAYPECSTFLLKQEQSNTFIGCSPEKLISVVDNQLRTEALAGTTARGTTDQLDKVQEYELMQSIKDLEEHNYVVNDIKKLVAPFVTTLESAQQPVIKKLANVQHLYSPIRGMIKEDEHALAIAEQLHPTPAVGGTPRKEALKYIQQHEPFSRGWFAAPVGWITTSGEAEFTVAIRSGLISKDTALLFAGCGIVADSDPEKEWQETNLKFMPMLSALNYD